MCRHMIQYHLARKLCLSYKLREQLCLFLLALSNQSTRTFQAGLSSLSSLSSQKNPVAPSNLNSQLHL